MRARALWNRATFVASLIVLLVVSCKSPTLESKYPDEAVRNAPNVQLIPADISLTEHYFNLGIVAGSSCEDAATAERILRLEAAKMGANAVFRYECRTHYAPGCPKEYACRGKAVVLPAGA